MQRVKRCCELMGVAVFFAAMYLLVQWVTISFGVTHNGETIQFKRGLEAQKEYWCGD